MSIHMKDLLGKLLSGVGGLIAIYLVAIGTFNGCVTRMYVPEEQVVYRFQDRGTDFQHYVLLSGNRAAVYRGLISEDRGEFALQHVTFEKWDWYLPHVFYKKGVIPPFGIRILKKDCIPTEMEWRTLKNETLGGIRAHYDDDSYHRTTVKFYDDGTAIFGDATYERYTKKDKIVTVLERLIADK